MPSPPSPLPSPPSLQQLYPDLALPEFEAGWVWLTGAGPGDAGLLTLHAIHALQQADYIIHDALVGPEILSFANPHANIKFAGKRGGKPSPRQQDITADLIQLAQAGRRVLRLKGGDPFIFGRGGEEALALVQAHVPFRIIPGITSGCAGPAMAGIPLTHRDHNSAVTFLTGHDASGDVPDHINWQALSDGAPVLVLYMSLKHIGRIVDHLCKAGRPEAQEVAVLSHATLPEQRLLRTNLGRLKSDLVQYHFKAPCIFVIGPVVALQPVLAPFLKYEGSFSCSPPI